MLRRSRLNPRSPKRTKERAPWHPQLIRLDAQGMGALRQAVFTRSVGMCEWIKPDGARCYRKITWFDFELHHVVPRSRGGNDTEENTRALCAECHKTVHGKLMWTQKEKNDTPRNH